MNSERKPKSSQIRISEMKRKLFGFLRRAGFLILVVWTVVSLVTILIELVPGQGYFLREHHRPRRKKVQRSLAAAERDPAVERAPLALYAALRYGLLTVPLGALYLGLVAQGNVAALPAAAVVAAVFLPARSLLQKLAHRVVFASF